MVILLNSLQLALLNIVEYQDRVVLDGAYKQVITNIQSSMIYDQDFQDFVQRLDESLHPFILTSQERTGLLLLYDRDIVQQFYATSLQPQVSSLEESLALGAAGITEIGGLYTYYRQHIEDYHQRLDSRVWTLPHDVLPTIYELQKQFSPLYWRFIQAYNLPDMLQLKEDDIKRFIAIVREPDPEKRLRQLAERNDTFSALPTFWYEYAHVASAVQPSPSSLQIYEYIGKTRIDFFRDDYDYMQMLMEVILLKQQIALLSEDTPSQPTIENALWINDLEQLTEICPEDWRKTLFVALQYSLLREYPTATTFIQRNLDSGKDVSLHTKLLGELYILTDNEEALVKLFTEMSTNPEIRYQDVLYLLGYVREGAFLQKLLIQFLQPVITPIGLTVHCPRLYGEDTLTVTFPLLWFRTSPDDRQITVTQLNTQLETLPQKPPLLEQGTVRASFSEVITCKEIFTNNVQKYLSLNISDTVQPVSVTIKAHLNENQKKIVVDVNEVEVAGTCYRIVNDTWEKVSQCSVGRMQKK